MKITEIKTHIVGNPWKNWIFVEVLTDEGLTGFGEATGGLATKPIVEQLKELGRFVLGENPLNPHRVWEKMYKGIYLMNSPAISGIEIACWDILGKTLNTPVWQLLGGKVQPKLRAYANGWYQGPRDPAFFAEAATKVVENGYTALKFDPFGSAYRFMDQREMRLSLAIIAAVREAVGEDVDLLIEAHDRLSVSTAVQMGRALEAFKPMWFETPVMSTDIRATIEVAKAINIPVASGERFRRLSECLDLVSSRVVSILQTETLNIGGIAQAAKSAAIAESAEAFVALHQAQSPFNTAVNAHIHTSLPNFLIQECFDDFLAPWAKDIMTGVPQVVDGYLEAPNEPGIGVQLNFEEMAKHPYGQNNFLRLFEDGWERRSS